MLFDGEKIYEYMREMNRDGHPRRYGEPPMKLKDLARITEIKYQTLWEIANTGVRKKSPDVEKAIRIAEALNKKLDDFLSV